MAVTNFKIIGDGAFAKALYNLISSKGGAISNTDYDWIIPCVPSYALTQIDLESDKKILFVSKGMIEIDGNPMLISQWARNMSYAILAGPHLASELGAGMRAMSTIATSQINYFHELGQYFPSARYCRYVDFVELASVLKNIIAYVCGMYDGAGWGENAKASILANSTIELINIANYLGLEYEMSCLSEPGVLGDMILTGTSSNSRNFRAGRSRILGQNSSDLIESRHSSLLLKKLIGESEFWPFISAAFQANESDSQVDLETPWKIASFILNMH